MSLQKTLFPVFLLVFMTGYAQRPPQQPITITGTVLDAENNRPLEYATLVLQSTRNPEAVTGGITDANGKFTVETRPGRYNIRIEYISYVPYELKDQLLQSSKDLGTIKLSVDVAQLNEVEVVGERTTVELRLDKKIYNVGQDLTVSGGSVTDVLDNIPSVTVDVEGNIALRGNDNVRILINGKPSALSGMSPETLQQLPADAIEKVEVITNPSARYDAEGTAGILNIILKQSKTAGINGAVNLYAGHPDNYGGSLSLNLRSDTFNFFTNTTYRYRNAPGNALFEQENFDTDGTTIGFQDEYRNYNRQSGGFTNNLGFEYIFDKSSSITSSFVYRKSDGDNTVNVDFFHFDTNRDPSISRNRFTEENEFDENVQYSVNFAKNFKKDGHKFTFDYQYSRGLDIENSVIDEIILEENTLLPTERTFTNESQKNQLVQFDYVLPLGKENSGQFEFGYRGIFNVFDTDFQFGIQKEDVFTLDPDFTNTLIYKEYVNALYTQIGNKFGKFSVLTGLRMEASDIGVNLITTSVRNDKNYVNWFPSVFLGYEFSETEQLTLSYSKRLRRPRSRFINPFPSRSSNTNLFQGNPNLDPTYTGAFDFGYLKRWNKMTFTTSAYYNQSTGVFQFITLETGDFVQIENPDYDEALPQDPLNNPETIDIPVQVRTPINLATENRYGVEFTTTYTPKRNWRLTWNLNVFKQEKRGDYTYTNFEDELITQNFDADNFTWFTRLSARLPLPGKINFQTNLFYRGPTEDAQNKNKGILSSNLAFSKDILKDKATLSLNVSDIFNSRKRRSTSTTSVAETYSEFQWRERQITLSFLFRFNKPKEQRGGRRGSGGGEDFEFEG